MTVRHMTADYGDRKGDRLMGWIWHLCLMNMKRRGVRTFLTVLGVMIGVISVVALLAVGIGVKNELIDSVIDSGSVNQIKIYSENSGRHKDKMITDRTVKTFEEIPHISACYPVYEIQVVMTYGQYEYWGELVGIPRDVLDSYELKNGGMSPARQSSRPELIAGSGVGKLFMNQKNYESYQKMERKGIESLVGKRIDTAIGWNSSGETSMSKVKLKLAGVIADDTGTAQDIQVDEDESGYVDEDSLGLAETYSEQSQTIYCDIESLVNMLRSMSRDGRIEGQPLDGNGNAYHEFVYSSAVVTVDDISNVDAMVKKFQDMGYQTENQKEQLDTIQKYVSMIELLLAGIGMIALVVAVIGISNTMTTAVFDRVNEVGILKVLGCDIDELRMMFLVEAAVIGFVGGVLGVTASYGVRLVINKSAELLFHLTRGTQIAMIPWWLALTGIFGSVILGVAAGYFPARWASKLRPIDAVTRR